MGSRSRWTRHQRKSETPQLREYLRFPLQKWRWWGGTLNQPGWWGGSKDLQWASGMFCSANKYIAVKNGYLRCGERGNKSCNVTTIIGKAFLGCRVWVSVSYPIVSRREHKRDTSSALSSYMIISISVQGKVIFQHTKLGEACACTFSIAFWNCEMCLEMWIYLVSRKHARLLMISIACWNG